MGLIHGILQLWSMLSRPDPQQGGEPLRGERSKNIVALLQASEAVASAQYAPILQMEWETSVNWGEPQPNRLIHNLLPL